jgi:hypothetical protein
VFNLKWGGIAAAGAFAISILVGLVSGTGYIALIRALVFGAIFFALANCCYWLITRYLPGLLDETAGSEASAGSRVDISTDDEALPGMYRNEAGDGEDSFVDLDTLTATPLAGTETAAGADSANNQDSFPENGPPLDQNGEDRYTKEGNGNSGEKSDDVPPAVSAGSSSEITPDDADLTDMFPDLDGTAEGSFSPADEGKAEPVRISPRAGSSGGSKKAGTGGDYNPKDVASAIQTILKREE